MKRFFAALFIAAMLAVTAGTPLMQAVQAEESTLVTYRFQNYTGHGDNWYWEYAYDVEESSTPCFDYFGVGDQGPGECWDPDGPIGVNSTIEILD